MATILKTTQPSLSAMQPTTTTQDAGSFSGSTEKALDSLKRNIPAISKNAENPTIKAKIINITKNVLKYSFYLIAVMFVIGVCLLSILVEPWLSLLALLTILIYIKKNQN